MVVASAAGLVQMLALLSRLPMQLSDDDFQILGLERRFGVDLAVLETQWRRLQAEVHPDRHAAGGAAAQRVAMQWSVRLNEAHRRLKDPLTRAAYLCELAGVPIQSESNTTMPAAFLMQQMEWRERLDEASNADSLERLRAEVAQDFEARLALAARQLDEQSDAVAASGTVRALMFTRRFLRDLAERADSATRA